MGGVIVSVIIPLYNCEKFVLQTLDSVYHQTDIKYECIIVDDGSVDNSAKIVKDFIIGKDNFSYYYQDNSGVCIARNYGVSLSKGKYLLFLDSDDLLDRGSLKEMCNLIGSESAIDIVSPKTIFFGRSKGQYLPSGDLSIRSFLHENKLVVSCLIEKEKFIRAGQFNENMKKGLEDWDFWIRFVSCYPKILVCEKAIFRYRILSKSRNRSISRENETKLRKQIWENNKELFASHFIDPKDTFEYKVIEQSYEYKLGSVLMKPIRFLLRK
ncbi:glycosyltransferase family 2 protein [Myroides marinus]|uniref:glycosyltransferase family 2 protein n=1 Tax=Myroides marinus TaxID=703342 RepID=UPI002575F74F|nr:glycosyltransferase [Myroides marinus]MDM1373365.1 glycosyltransferase [Myroides marinus]